MKDTEEWISVKDELPPYDYTVMYAIKSGSDGFWLHYGERLSTDKNGEWWVSKEKIKHNNVSHWRKVYPPQPPPKSI